MNVLGRIGLAIVRPGRALALAGRREAAGQAGIDLVVAIALLLAATQLRGLAAAAWLGEAVDWGLGGRLAVHVLTGALALDLGLLLLAAIAVWAGAGPRRELGRAFDLACVAALPIVVVELAAGVVALALGIALPVAVVAVVQGLAYAWTGGLVVLAILHARRPVAAASLPPEARRVARRAGAAVALFAAAGIGVQAVAIARAPGAIRPMTSGRAAPAFALHRIGPGGALGAPVTLADAAGKVTVLDFWATWCRPCRASLPRLDALARRHPEALFVAVNLDDPAAARAMFDAAGYRMTLVADDGQTSERYGVTTIPHTVVLDRTGVVRAVFRGGGLEVDAAIEALLH